MFSVLVILTLAWALSDVTDALRAGEFLAHLLGEALPPAWVPALIFVLAAAISFATGTSWGTMGILVPLAVPLAWAVGQSQGLGSGETTVLLNATTAAVLSGAIWGDHTSPISDTTVLAAATSRCGLVEHVNTQLPYGILVGVVAVLCGLVPAGYGFPWWVGMAVSIAVLVAVIWFVGASNDPAEQGSTKTAESAAE